MLCDDLERYDCERGREAQEGRNVCVLTADSRCCTVEIDTLW